MKLTPQNKKIAGFALIVLLLIIIIYMNKDKPVIANLIKKPQTPPPVIKTTDQAFNVKDAVPPANDNFPLKQGSKGDRVKTLQQALNRINDKRVSKFTPLVVDGSFGDKTYSAIVTWVGTKYWGANGLTETAFNEINAISNQVEPSITTTPAATPTFSWVG